MSIKHRLDRLLYPRHSDNWDDWTFREKLLSHLASDHVVLDVGAGAGIVEQTRVGGDNNRLAAKVCGIDPDERVLENPFLDDAKVGWADALPYNDATFDLVFSCNVLEHLEDPNAVFREIYRVLKPGGVFISKTPNQYHYVPLLASITPHWFHQWYNGLRGRSHDDTFPTYYRANSRRSIRRLATSVGMEVEEIELVEGRPEYLRITPFTYLGGFAYERMVNSTRLLSGFRCVLIAVLRKPANLEVQHSRAA